MLSGTHVVGTLYAAGAKLTNDSGPALHAYGLQVGQDLFLADQFAVTGAGEHATVALGGAHVGGPLTLNPVAIRGPTGEPGSLDLDGLVYAGLPREQSVTEWLHTLSTQTTEYAHQPYRQLASATQAAGHDGDTRKILIAQRRDQLGRRAIVARSERAWARLTGITLGYGYQPWRALLFLMGTAALGVTLALILGAHGALAHVDPTSGDNASCTTTERIGVGLDLSLPLIKTTASDACAVTTTTAGDILTISGWMLQVAAWAFATLFIAGFTSAVRKT
jgi:hypothetical protein